MRTIKNASSKDIPLIRKLNSQVWPQTYASLLTKEQIDYMLDLMYSNSSLEKQMIEGCQFIIIYEKNDPVGFASYQQLSSSLWKLHKLYVLPDQQGKGTGRHMIEHIIAIILEKKGNSLQLQVNRNNRAKEFYEKLGFSILKELDLDIGNGFFMKDYIMEKKF